MTPIYAILRVTPAAIQNNIKENKLGRQKTMDEILDEGEENLKNFNLEESQKRLPPSDYNVQDEGVGND